MTDQTSSATAAIRDNAERASNYASEKLHSAADQVRETSEAARIAAAEALENARNKVSEAGTAAKNQIKDNPVSALVAGIAVGAVIGALLPRSEREAQLLAPVGNRISDAAREAISAAKEAGRETLDDLGLNKSAASNSVEKLAEAARKAASAAGTAAATAARGTGTNA